MSARDDTVEHQDVPHRSVLGRLWQATSWVLLAAAFAILFAAIVIPKISGGAPYTVLTGSMRPTYPPGTLVVVRPVAAGSIRVGDVITYQIRSGDPAVVTHRVTEVTHAPNGELRFTARGDDNDAADPLPVRPVQVRGEVWYSIPYLGYVNTWFTGVRRSVIVFVLAGLLFAYGAWELYAAHREQRREPPEDASVAADPPTEPLKPTSLPTATEEDHS
ncbi:signal peptidase I [Gordonia humi]|uniref:Signal peptidase I n=2 Tax=Gordonia humi TaxID=686429 RepID=A0A840FAK3_9ACTN|nr:signal peptidase I [Gordonia humi]MBB4137180.1 signal peptidase [Gordonia humi]